MNSIDNRLEGNGASRILQMMRQVGGSNIDITIASVTQAPPSLAIRLDGDPFDLTGDELIVAEHLTQYTRQASINGGPFNSLVVRSGLSVGDKVIVISAQDGQVYYVLDKAV